MAEQAGAAAAAAARVSAALEATLGGESDTRPTAATAAVVAGGAVVCTAAAGSVDGEPADAGSTVFLTASISKTFLAALALQCAERGELTLDEDISVHLAGPLRNPHFPERAITARQLLQHRSSLCDDESALQQGSPYRWAAGAEATVSLEQYVERRLSASAQGSARLWSLKDAPGDAPYHYSNAGFTLLGLVVERAAGLPLGELGQQRLFRPLGMLSTGYFLSDLPQAASGGLPQLQFAEPQGQPEGHYEVAEFPAAQVRSTALDLCKWLLFLTAADPPASRETVEASPPPTAAAAEGGAAAAYQANHPHEGVVLSPASIQEMLPASYDRSLAWWGLDAAYGEGVPGVYTHGGFMEGVRTHIYLWPAGVPAVPGAAGERSSGRGGCGCVVLLNGEAEYDGVVAEMKMILTATVNPEAAEKGGGGGGGGGAGL
jgi:CubicO group peptidase (beta-lactamase class C family)